MTTSAATWDITGIRRALRVFGAQSCWASDPVATARGLRLVHDMIARRGIHTELVQVPGTMPLLVAGEGPVLLVTYLDDTHPGLQNHPGALPEFVGDDASAPGLTRKAGVLAACGTLLGTSRVHELVTVVVESDRHAGSVALEHWLERSGRRFIGAWWEAVDLPVRVPAIYRTGMGRLLVSVSITADGQPVEDAYAGVVSDVGHRLAAAVAGLKSVDDEVLLPGFYDDVSAPSNADLADIERNAARVAAWASPSTAEQRGVRHDHLTLSAFVTPSLTLRDFQVNGTSAFLPTRASATIDIRLLPGQSPNVILLALTHLLRERLPGAAVEPLLVRQPGMGRLLQVTEMAELAPTLPIAPGDSPAGVLEASGIPSAGFATVTRRSPGDAERVSLASIVSATDTLATLVGTTARVGSPRGR